MSEEGDALLRTYTQYESRVEWREFVSPTLRTKKKMIRTFLDLFQESKFDGLGASGLEVLVACAVAVMHGYWSSAAPSERKAEVLDGFGLFFFNVVLNGFYLESSSFQIAHKADPNGAMKNVEQQVRRLMEKRTAEYTDAMNMCLTDNDRRSEAGQQARLPSELAAVLARNIFGTSTPSSNQQVAGFAFALPFMQVFARGMGQFK